MPTGVEELIAKFGEYRERKAYVALKKACRAKVSEWRWARFKILAELPHENLVSGMTLKWVKKRPRPSTYYGLDEFERVLCLRSDDLERQDDDVEEGFLVHDDA